MILLCDVYEATHIQGVARRVGIDSKAWKRVKQNRDERFHYLQQVPSASDNLAIGFSALGVDFKRAFGLSPELIYGQLQETAKRRFKLESPYLEHLATRFFSYQARIALPVPHEFE